MFPFTRIANIKKERISHNEHNLEGTALLTAKCSLKVANVYSLINTFQVCRNIHTLLCFNKYPMINISYYNMIILLEAMHLYFIMYSALLLCTS